MKKEPLKRGGFTWTYRYYTIRATDGKRVERSLKIGTTATLPTEKAAWAEVDRQRLAERVNENLFVGAATVEAIANHFIEYELGDQNNSIRPLSHTTVATYRRIINLRIMPRWGKRLAGSVGPFEIEQWLQALRQQEGLSNGTAAKTRNVFSLVFKHALRVGLLPPGERSNPLALVRCRTTSDYEARTITPVQAASIWKLLPQCEALLLLLAAATGVRVSEGLGLKWGDLDLEHKRIHIRRSWTAGKIGPRRQKPLVLLFP